jgi:hypothetical protein
MITGTDILIGLGILVVISAIGSVYLIRHPEKLDPNNPVNIEYHNKIAMGEIQDPRSLESSNLSPLGSEDNI